MKKKNRLFDEAIERNLNHLRKQHPEEREDRRITLKELLAVVIMLIFAAAVAVRMFL